MATAYQDSYSEEQFPTTWRSDRKFIPAELYGDKVDLDSNDYDIGDECVHVPCHHGSVCKNCGRFQPHRSSMIIAVDGCCRGNGTNTPHSSIGIHFAWESKWNISRLLKDPAPTSQKAELKACLIALHKAFRVRSKGPFYEELDQVVIKSDSAYVVRGLTEWIFKWKTNGYKNCKGSMVTNADLFQQIERQIATMNTNGIEVLFWHVPRSRNEEADSLANLAFDKGYD